MVELREVRREKEQAIRAQEFDKAASLREKETELSDKLRELKSKSIDTDEPKE
jgi:ATP-dependent Clp protease ATP-binding subunit ClpC